jgi:DNA-binding transcriptional regulator PaaX
MQIRSAHKHDVAKDILLLLHGGSLLTLSMFAPDRIRTTLHKYWRLSRHSPAQLRRTLKYLLSRELIKFHDEDGLKVLNLTDKGRRKVSHFELEDTAIPIPLKWDGKWRMILFDVPESKKSARNALSLYLKSMGFIKMQDSVWIHPYSCEKEVSTLRHALNLGEHLRIIVADSLENDAILREHFHLS